VAEIEEEWPTTQPAATLAVHSRALWGRQSDHHLLIAPTFIATAIAIEQGEPGLLRVAADQR
jgi:hypothetical protein